jgi:hypothetical protein
MGFSRFTLDPLNCTILWPLALDRRTSPGGGNGLRREDISNLAERVCEDQGNKQGNLP